MSDEKIFGNLISRLDHPVVISYNGEATRLSPRASSSTVEKAKIGALPKGVVFVPKAS